MTRRLYPCASALAAHDHTQQQAESPGHPLAGFGHQGEQIFSRSRRDSFLVPRTLGFHSTIAPRFSFLQCRNQSAPVTHQDQGCRPERVRITPLAAMTAPENRRCPTRVHVARLAPMTDLWLPERGASGINPWWFRAEANRSSRAGRRTAAQSGLTVVSQPRAWFTASAPFLRRMPAAVKLHLLPPRVIAGARRCVAATYGHSTMETPDGNHGWRRQFQGQVPEASRRRPFPSPTRSWPMPSPKSQLPLNSTTRA